jgi:hypothetical protein
MLPPKTGYHPHAEHAGSGLTKRPELPLDRRKHRRYRGKEGALVSPVAAGRKYWKMLDVGMGGASFRYIPYEDMASFEEIDIVMQDLDFALEGIPFRVVSDCKFEDGLSPSSRLRRCGVEFRLLTHAQESLLERFIREYTEGEVVTRTGSSKDNYSKSV